MKGSSMKNFQPALLYFCLLGIIPVGAEAAQQYSISKNGSEVTDKKTGLIWRRCTEGMSWNGKTCTGNPTLFIYKGAVEFSIAESTKTNLQWRVPMMSELFTIVDKDHSHPAINPKIFPATPAASFWVTSPAVTEFRYGWNVDFDGGYMNYSFNNGETRHVRLVRNAR